MNKQNIFLSYSHTNKNIIWNIADRLKQNHSIRIDRDCLIPGVDQDMEISNEMKNATTFLPFISKNYCNSEACRKEFALAENKGEKFLSVMLEKEVFNGIDYKISNLTTFYAFKPPNVFNPWYEVLFQKLLNHILNQTLLASNFNNLNLELVNE
jgi:hypothetical protein